MKLTPWFSAAEHNPVHHGVYEVSVPSVPMDLWARFESGFWYAALTSVRAADATCNMSCDMYRPGAKWRGIKK